MDSAWQAFLSRSHGQGNFHRAAVWTARDGIKPALVPDEAAGQATRRSAGGLIHDLVESHSLHFKGVTDKLPSAAIPWPEMFT